jgi:uncharacterized protein
MQVKGVGKRVFEQCAGFLRVRDGPCALDNTPIHPESYSVVSRLAKQLKNVGKSTGAELMTSSDLAELGRMVSLRSWANFALELSNQQPLD